jgi:hypothetical protein
MSAEPLAPTAAMEGKGAYNRYAKLQASGAALAMACWTDAVQRVALTDPARPLVIADYGSSQGHNSFAPIGTAISGLRSRVGAERPILVYHIDLPANDFNALFAALRNDPERYTAHDARVFPCAIGCSFYDSVLPPDYVDLAWSAYAAQWLSRVPCAIPGHFFPNKAEAETRTEFKRQRALDWERFLSLRAQELRPGGRLVVALPMLNQAEETGIDEIMDQANEVITDMVEDRALSSVERARMVVGVVAQQRLDMLAPFASAGQFCGLRVEHCETQEVIDPAWREYERDGDREALARAQARFVRSAFAPTLALALDDSDRPLRLNIFSERLEQGLTARRVRCPAPIRSHVGTIVLAKQ